MTAGEGLYLAFHLMTGWIGWLIFLYRFTDAFETRELTWAHLRGLALCLAVGPVSLFFMLMIITVKFFEEHDNDVAISWGSKPKKEMRDPWKKADD